MAYVLSIVAAGIFLGVAVWQLYIWVSEVRQKHNQYKAAVAHARKAGKPLLVAGGPWGSRGIRHWLKMPAHGGGDVCLDINRRAVGQHSCGVVADVAQVPFCDKAFGAAFTSHLLEHLPTIGHAGKALGELNRVADAVFIAYPSRQSIGAWLHPGHNLWVWQKSGIVYVQARSNSQEAAKGGTLPRILRREPAVVRLCYEDREH